MSAKTPLLLILLLAGCMDAPADSVTQPEPVAGSLDGLNETRVWSAVVNVTTRGAVEAAGYYYQSGVPGMAGVTDPGDPNCVQLVVRGARLANLTAVATWTASGPEENLLLYHYLKESDGPFRGAENDRGTSPLLHVSDFEGRITSTEWLTVGVHPATGLPAWRGSVDSVQIEVTLAGTWPEEATPIVEELEKCSPQHKQIL